MSTRRRAGPAIGMIALGACWAMVACGEDFEARATPDGGSAGDSGATDSGDAPNCDLAAAPREDGCAVREEFGIFVAPQGSDATGDGTRAAPLATFTAAMAMSSAKNKPRIYACQGEYADALKIATGKIAVFGGFSCGDWSYSGVRATVKPAGTGAALRIEKADDVLIEDIDFVARDGTAFGESSIAGIVATATNVTIRRSRFEAGKGAPGSDASQLGSTAKSGTAGSAGQNECLAGQPGPQTTTQCDDGSVSTGGKGGHGQIGVTEPGSGEPGLPDYQNDMGNGGVGQNDIASAAGWNCEKLPGKGGGQDGAVGSAGMRGAGAHGKGALTAAGYSGLSGESGANGKPGQGGGGGGGAWHDGCALANPTLGNGAAAGSGGGGGCGGKGGDGGGPGGSSIALVSVDSDVSLNAVDLIASEGGVGGKGAMGQPGGLGGPGGPGGTKHPEFGLTDACPGGNGGSGGPGGPGGGGLGGHSIALGFVGAIPNRDSATTLQFFPQPTAGGAGGDDNPDNQGSAGIAVDAQAF